MFNSPLHKAIMVHVKTKIKAADKVYKDMLLKHETNYSQALKNAKQVLEQNKSLALEDSIKSVIASLQ